MRNLGKLPLGVRLFVSALGVSLLTACYSSAESDGLRLRLIHQSEQCLNSPEGLSLVESEVELSSIMAASIQYSLDGEVLTELPELDFESERVIVASLGLRSTAGYGLFLPTNQVELIDQTLFVDLQPFEPRGDRVAQMMTNPCVVIAVPALDIKAIEAMGYRLDF